MLLSLKNIKTKYKNFPTKVLHLGAHLGEELQEYAEIGITDAIWVEGNSSLIPQLESITKKSSINSQVYNILISENDKEVLTFNITDFDQSSSVLAPKLTSTIHNTKVKKTEKIIGRRLDAYFEENNVETKDYKLLCIDLQGYELPAIKSLGNKISYIDFIITEVNIRELYNNCTNLKDLDRYLLAERFVRKETIINENFWGDALYVRLNKINQWSKFNMKTSLILHSSKATLKNFYNNIVSSAYTIYYFFKR